MIRGNRRNIIDLIESVKCKVRFMSSRFPINFNSSSWVSSPTNLNTIRGCTILKVAFFNAADHLWTVHHTVSLPKLLRGQVDL